VVNTYAPNLLLTRGQGCRVWDSTGRSYLDFLGGIAVTQVGHCHPKLVSAIQKQAATLMHVSNLYYNENAPRLAAKLVEKFGVPGRVFFCNSGAEANEGLIKLARLWGHPPAATKSSPCGTRSTGGPWPPSRPPADQVPEGL
jgi:acetylornithine/N-succinyldiaminopimelate aminotransferase